MSERKKVVIIGGGFAGLSAARALQRASVDITLIDKRNFHLFQPLLYQVATGGLSPADIASPLRGILGQSNNIRVMQGAVTDMDLKNLSVLMGANSVSFDYLIVATGSRHHYFGNDSWERWAPGLKTIEDALTIRRRVLSAFERAEIEDDPERRQAWMQFVIVGGGPTGVELAGALGELAHHTLRHDFKSVDPVQTKILLIEATDRLLPAYPPSLSGHAAQSLMRLGVTVRTNTTVHEVQADFVTLAGESGHERIATRTVLWGAGVKASSLGRRLAAASDVEVDRQGRVVVEPDLSLAGHPDIFVLGDLAHCRQDGQPLPGVAPVAMQQGTYVGKLIRKRLRGREGKAFHYKDRGSMAVIGRAAAVAEIGRLRFHGFWAWLVWLFVHLVNLIEYENRVLVLIQWGWNYFTRNRSARLITFEQESVGAAHVRRDGPIGAGGEENRNDSDGSMAKSL